MQEFDLIQRSRRLRGNPVLRELVRETRVSPSALIYPLFIREGQRVREPIPSLEGQYRYSSDTLLWELETLEKAGVTRVLLFGIHRKRMPVGAAHGRRTGLSRRLCGKRSSGFRNFSISPTYAFVSIRARALRDPLRRYGG